LKADAKSAIGNVPMSSDRKQQITSIFHSAIEREGTERRAFLDGACANDAELRREVESLIHSHENAGSLMDSPAYQRDASLVDEMDQGNFVGRTLGHYRIVSRLGGGGMGEVFLAEDTQLGRRVAVKILPHRLTSDSSLVARFRQEARAASALNHANIVTIYEVGESEGTHFIATEYVEGMTLRERMSRTALTVGETLDIAAQIAAALSKAHSAGVVHRDIKPENVMVDDEGHAKVLDFGIAKLVEQTRESATEAPTVLKVETSPGAVMGTAHYMSPEQARALRDVDARTDVWSLGVVLYEMLAGRLPFEGETPSDVIVAILNKEPLSLARFNREVSEALELAVEKALEKNRDERYQTVKEMASDLRRIRQRFESGASSPRFDDQTDAGAAERATSLMGGAPGTDGARPDETTAVHTTSSAEYIVTELKRHKRGIVIALVALAAVAAGLWFALYKYSGREKPASPPIFQNVQQARITTSGRAGECNISPDGRYIVYKEMADDGNESLWIRQTETGNTLQIVPPAKVTIHGTTFSPDGDFVYYVFHDRTGDTRSLYRVPSIGGETKKMLADVGGNAGSVSISPDGRRAAFVRSEMQIRTSLVVANLDGTGERAIATGDDLRWFEEDGPAWSPDGRIIACQAGMAAGDDISYSLVGVDVENGAVKELSPKRWNNIGRAVWMPDGRAVLLLAFDVDNWQLWRVSLPGGDAAPITNFLNGSGQTSLGVTADGRKVVTVALDTVSQVWTMPANGDTSRAKQITSGAGQDGHRGLAWTPDGRIVFSSRDGGQSDMWIMNADGSNRRRLTSDANKDLSPAVAPDGRYVVFETNRTKSNLTEIWRMDLDGGNLKQLTRSGTEQPHVSPDGRWVVFQSWGERGLSLGKVSIDGGEPVRLTDYLSSDPVFSPDGNWIAFSYYDDKVTPKRSRNAIIPAAGGTRTDKLFDRPNFRYQHVQWVPDGRNLSYIGAPAVPSNIWLQPVAGGEPRKLTDFKSDSIYHHVWSRDGKWLALARGAETVDVVLLTDSR
jgi:Tol biopolymer transport system component/serine/threonine protein kinase